MNLLASQALSKLLVFPLLALCVCGANGQELTPVPPGPLLILPPPVQGQILSSEIVSQPGNVISGPTNGSNSGIKSVSLTISGPTSLRVGESGKYEIRVQNLSAPSSKSIEVEATLPEHVEYVGSSSQPTREGKNIRWRIAGLNEGETKSILFEATVKTSDPIDIQVAAYVAATTAMRVSVTEPKLDVRVNGPVGATLGDLFDCQVTVTNVGNGEIRSGGLKLLASSGLKVRTEGVSQKGPFSLAPGKSITVTVPVQASLGGPQGLRAEASSEKRWKADGEHKLRITQPQLSAKLIGPDHRLVGKQAEYELRIQSTGDAASKDVIAFVELPGIHEFVSADSQGSYEKAQHMVFWRVGQMPPGDSKSVRVVTKVRSAGNAEIRGSAKAAFKTYAESYVTTKSEGHLAINVEVVLPEEPIGAGNSTNLIIKVTNRGSLTAQSLKLTARPSSGLELDAKLASDWKSTTQSGEWTWPLSSPIAPEETVQVALPILAANAGDYRLTVTLGSPDLPGDITRSDPIRIVGKR